MLHNLCTILFKRTYMRIRHGAKIAEMILKSFYSGCSNNNLCALYHQCHWLAI